MLNEMLSAVARTFGLEHPATIYFFDEAARATNPVQLETAFDIAMSWPDDEE